jgi:hypothetical protein
LTRPSRAATQHSFTWQSHRIGIASELTRGSQNACYRWRSLRSAMATSATYRGCGGRCKIRFYKDINQHGLVEFIGSGYPTNALL